MAGENELMKSIRVAINATGKGIVLRNTVGFDREHRQMYGLGKGSPDLVGMVFGSGRAFCLEVKTSTGRVSREQDHWIRYCNKRGGFARVVRSVEEALGALHDAQ